MAALMMRDPREGNRRQKQTLQQILQQLAQRRQALAGRTGPGRMGRAAGGGARLFGGGRPTAASFLQPRGLQGNPNARAQAGSPPGLQRVAASAGRPLSPLAPPPPMPGSYYQGPQEGAPYGDNVPWPGSPGFDMASPGDPGAAFGSSGGLGLVELPRIDQRPVAQSGPGGQLTVGGMIPLGGGQYLDPNTLVIHGSGPGSQRIGQ